MKARAGGATALKWNAIMKKIIWVGMVVVYATISVRAENFVVTNTLASGPGSLANALAVAATNAPGSDVISFAIPGTPPFIISPTSALPELRGFTIIDGTTQSGFSNNYPAIVLNGSLILQAGTHGFTTRGSENVIRGLRIEKFTGSGIRMGAVGGNAQSNRIEGCHTFSNVAYGIQLNVVSNSVVGGFAVSNRNVSSGNTAGGILVEFSAGNIVAGNWVGVHATNSAQKVPGQALGITLYDVWNTTLSSSSTATQVISGNNTYGLRIDGGGSNLVYGNFIGSDAAALTAVSNGTAGVLLYRSIGNRIGGTALGQRNFISGNGATFGLELVQTHENVIEGNYFGVNATGTSPLPNLYAMRIQVDASNNLVGGTSPGSANVISGNTAGGILINGNGNRVEGNSIGLGPDFLTVVGNGGTAVSLSGTNNVVGGTNSAARNVIAASTSYGIWLSAAVACAVQNNYIGLDALGTRRPNQTGVFLTSARNCLIGGPGAGNVISGNNEHGVRLELDPVGNVIQGNLIGTTVNGLSGASNGIYGIVAYGGTNNTIGGSEPGSRNVIAGNYRENVFLDTRTKGYTVAGNYIGVGVNGLTSFPSPDLLPGINVSGSDHVIGGSSTNARNVISGNPRTGVHIVFATNIAVQGNFIGLAADGFNVVPNGSDISSYGVRINVGTTRSLIGGLVEGARNVMAGHYYEVLISQSTSNSVWGNYIGYTASGTSMVAQTSVAVQIDPGSWNQIGGTNSGAGNLLYGRSAAVTIITTNSRHNSVAGNIINLDRFGNIATTSVISGVVIAQAHSNVVGGAGASARNIILAGGSGGSGVEIFATNTPGNIIRGNYIGVGPDGVSPRKIAGTFTRGIYLFESAGSTIGGTNAGEGNIIAHCTYGILVINPPATRNAIFGNTIYSNFNAGVSTPGIELAAAGADGTTPNDPVPDADSGPNNLQNFPVITNAFSFPGSTRLQGYLASAPNASYRLEFFYSETNNAEGRAYLGATNIVTAANGTGTFTTVLMGYANTNRYITSTATDAINNTSEFSPGIVRPTPAADSDFDGMPDYWETLYGLNPSFAGDATNSLDADGVNNRSEYLSGTIPNNPNSYLRITEITGQVNTVIRFTSSPYRNYDILAATTVGNSTTWTPISTNILGNGLTLTFVDLNTTNTEYYSIRAFIP